VRGREKRQFSVEKDKDKKIQSGKAVRSRM